MDVRKTILLAAALIIAVISALLAKSMFADAAVPPANAAVPVAPVSGPKILVATRALPVGTILTPESVRFQPWPSDLIDNVYFREADHNDISALAGRVVRTAISAGQPITQGALVKPGDRGFLAAALGPGMRAIAVPVSAQSGVAGFVFPGDRVDMVLTQSIDRDGAPLRTSETIIRNLRVLATDQRTTPATADGKQEVMVSQTVTLEVTPRIAEKIAVAQSIGQLSLTLRSITDPGSDLERAMAAGEVKMPAGADVRTEKQILADFAARPNDSNPTFVTAADVSRFQRAAPVGASAPRSPAPAPVTAVTNSPPAQPVVRVWRSGAADGTTN